MESVRDHHADAGSESVVEPRHDSAVDTWEALSENASAGLQGDFFGIPLESVETYILLGYTRNTAENLFRDYSIQSRLAQQGQLISPRIAFEHWDHAYIESLTDTCHADVEQWIGFYDDLCINSAFQDRLLDPEHAEIRATGSAKKWLRLAQGRIWDHLKSLDDRGRSDYAARHMRYGMAWDYRAPQPLSRVSQARGDERDPEGCTRLWHVGTRSDHDSFRETLGGHCPRNACTFILERGNFMPSWSLCLVPQRETAERFYRYQHRLCPEAELSILEIDMPDRAVGRLWPKTLSIIPGCDCTVIAKLACFAHGIGTGLSTELVEEARGWSIIIGDIVRSPTALMAETLSWQLDDPLQYVLFNWSEAHQQYYRAVRWCFTSDDAKMELIAACLRGNCRIRSGEEHEEAYSAPNCEGV